MSSSIGEGAHRLTEAAEIAQNRIAEIEDGMARHTSRLLDVAETAARNADYVKGQLKAQNDALVGLIKELTSRSDQIEAIVSNATSNLFAATDQAVLKAEQAGTTLATNAETLTEATQRAESLSNGIEDSFKSSIDRIREASVEIDQAFGTSIGKIREASEQATEQADTVGKALAEHSLSLTVAADHAADRAGFIARRLHKEVDELGQIADQVSTRTDQISASFANQGKAITDAAADFEHLAGQINVTAEEARRRLEDETRSHAQEMQRVSELAAEKARATVKAFSEEAGVLETTSDGIMDKVRLAGDAFIDQSKRIDEAAREAMTSAGNRVDQARIKLDEHLARLTRVTELAEALTNSLSSKFSAYVDQLSSATDQASAEAEVIGTSFKASGDSLMDATRLVGERTEQMRLTLESERGEIERISRELRAQSSEMEESMKAHTREMADAAERAATWAETAGRTFKSQTQEMTDSAGAATRNLIEQYETHARTVTAAANDAVDTVISGIEDKVRDHSKEVAWISEQAATRAEETLSGILGETRKFAAQTDAQFVDLVERFTGAVREQAASMAEAAQAADQQIGTASADFKAQATGIEEAIAGISAKANDAASNVTARATEAGDNIAEWMAKAGESITSTTNQAADHITAHMTHAGDSIAAKADELVDGITMNMASAGDSMAARVNEMVDGIVMKMASASDSMAARTNEAGENISARVDEANERISGLIARIGEQFVSETGSIEASAARLAEQIAARLTEAQALLDQHAALLDSVSEKSAGSIASAGEEFSRRSTELETASKLSREYIHESTESMRAEITAIAEMADAIAERVKSASAELAGQDAGLKGAADQAVAHLTAAGTLLEQRSTDLHEKSSTAREEISRVGDMFDQKILAFARAATGAKTGLLNAGKSLDDSAYEIDDRARGISEVLKAAGESLREEIRLLGEESGGAVARLIEASSSAQRHLRELSGQGSARSRPQAAVETPSASAAVQTPSPAAPANPSDRLAPATQAFVAGARLALKSSGKIASDEERSNALTSAAYVVECLEALDIDTVEIFDSPIPQDMWERYLNGEETLMSHSDHLLGTRKARALIRHRYNSDARFKAAISSYLTWLQDVIAIATGDNQAERTSTLRLLSSDMGTLYALLAQSVTLRL